MDKCLYNIHIWTTGFGEIFFEQESFTDQGQKLDQIKIEPDEVDIIIKWLKEAQTETQDPSLMAKQFGIDKPER